MVWLACTRMTGQYDDQSVVRSRIVRDGGRIVLAGVLIVRDGGRIVLAGDVDCEGWWL